MKEQILVVENEPEILELMRNLLHENGYEVLTANSANSAWRIISKQEPDLIVIDVVLPDIVGSRLSRILRQDDKSNSIPVIMISADSPKNASTFLSTVRANAFLAKPFHSSELIENIGRLLLENSNEKKDFSCR